MATDQNYPIIRVSPDQKNQAFPLTDMQESFLVGKYWGEQYDKVGCHAYFEIKLARLHAERLTQSWNALVQHHDMLRLVVEADGTQRIQEHVPTYIFPTYDFRQATDAERTAHLTAIRREMSHKVYECGESPLYDIRITRLDAAQALIHVSIDEWVVDAYSIKLLLHQWKQLYEGRMQQLPPLQVSFRDFVVASRDFEKTARFQADRQYWLNKLTAPYFASNLLTLPQHLPEGEQFFTRSGLEQRIPAPDWATIKQRAQQRNVSPTAVLLTAFVDVLGTLTTSEHYGLIATYYNRLPLHPQLDDVLGPFVSTSIHCVRKQASAPFAQKTGQCQNQLWEDIEHSQYSGISAVRELKTKRAIAKDATLSVVFTSMVDNLNAYEPDNWFDNLHYSITQTPQVYLDNQLLERNGTLHIRWDVVAEAFPGQQPERYFRAFCEQIQYLARPDVSWEQPAKPATVVTLPMTTLQQTILFNHLSGPLTNNNCSIYQEFDVSGIDADALNRAWNELISYHDSLRSVMTSDGRQILLADVPTYSMAVQAQASPEALRQHMVNQEFDPFTWPLFDLKLTRLANQSLRLHMHLSVLIADGKSLFTLYRQLFQRSTNPAYLLPALDYQAVRSAIPAAVQPHQQSYWEQRYHTLPTAPVFRRSTDSTSTKSDQKHRLSRIISGGNRLREMAKNQQVDANVLLLTTYAETLRHYSANNTDFALSWVHWDRPTGQAPLAEQAVGEFTSITGVSFPGTGPIRTQDYQAMLAQDRQHGLAGSIRALNKALLANGQQTGVVFTSLMNADDFPASVTIGYGVSYTPGVILDSITFVEGDQLYLNWDYKTAYWQGLPISDMFNAYATALETLLQQSTVATLPASFPAFTAVQTNHTDGFRCLHQLFEAQVRATPQAIALTFESRQVTYDELNQRANQLAHYLIEQGVGPDVLVGLFLSRSVDMLVSILAVLKAGGAYVPMDVTYPADRLQTIVDDAEVAVLLSQTALAGQLPVQQRTPVVFVDGQWASISQYPAQNPVVAVRPDHVAYVIYTSGSTGKPKGVMVSHGNVDRLFTTSEPLFGFGRQDVWTLFHSYAFDFSVWEIWGALLYGGRLVIVPYKVSRSFDAFHQLVCAEGVTVLNQTPTAFRQFIQIDQQHPNRTIALRYVIFGGEALEFHILKNWFAQHGDQQPTLVNMYGITETTVHVTHKPIRMNDLNYQASNIGVPLPDLQVYILNENRTQAPDGEIGELYVGGLGVTRGYLKRPELTAERFIANPLTPGATDRLYKSGDLGRKLPNGEIEYIGRSDFQVKVRGFRIELGEIENALVGCDGVSDCIAVVQDRQTDDPKIVAYLIVKPGYRLETKAIKAAIRHFLPIYMVPNVIKQVDAFPLTDHGKINSKALPWPVSSDDVLEIRTAASSVTVSTDEVLDWTDELTTLVKRRLSLQTLAPDDDFFELGCTSLTIIQLAKEIEKLTAVKIPMEVFLENATIAGLTRYLTTTKAAVPAQPIRLSTPAISAVSPAAEPSRPRAEIETLVLATFCQALNRTTIDPRCDIFDAGATSLTIVNIARKLSTALNQKFPMEVLLDNPTVAGVLNHILQTQPVGPVGAKIGKTAAQPTAACPPDYAAPALPLTKLAHLFNCLRCEQTSEGTAYLYASAGGSYAVKSYVYVREAAVDGMTTGWYAYEPTEHALYQVSEVDKAVWSNRLPDTYETVLAQAAFVLLLVADLRQLKPIYGDAGTGLASVEAGYMLRLLQEESTGIRLHEAPLAVYTGELTEEIGLSADHQVLISLLGFDATAYDQLQPTLISLADNAKRGGVAVPERLRQQTISNSDFRYLSDEDKQALVAQYRATQRQERANKPRIALAASPHAPERYAHRRSKRQFTKAPLSPEAVTQWLQTLPVRLLRRIKLYLYLKPQAVSGLETGYYSYEADQETLTQLPARPSKDLKTIHSPFNRSHYEHSSFSVFLVADNEAYQTQFGELGTLTAALDAGQIGQCLMDNQARFGVGVCPIGGVYEDVIRQNLGLNESVTLIHSFVGGGYAYTLTPQTHRPIATAPVRHRSTDVAVIGLGLRFPGASTPDELWAILERGDCVTTASANRPVPVTADEGIYSTEAGYLSHIDQFDNYLFNIAPVEAQTIDPQERLLLEVTWECLENAGYRAASLETDGKRVGVFSGVMWNDYQHVGLEHWQQTQVAQVPALPASLANRISYFFNFTGPSVVVNTSCSASLTALHMAQESLRRGECDFALVSGVNLIGHPYHQAALCTNSILSRTGQGHAFSEEADGLVIGEGAGVLLLRRADEAITDQDYIWGLINATAIGHTGKTPRFGMSSIDGLAKSLRYALQQADVDLSTITYVEAAATGASLADAAEVRAIQRVFTQLDRRGTCAIGSVKPNLGHLEAASGLSQVIKVLLQLQKGYLTPSRVRHPINPMLDLEESDLIINEALTVWQPASDAVRRRALVNSIGSTGSVAHVILEEAPIQPVSAPDSASSHVFVLSAGSSTQLTRYAQRYIDWLSEHPACSLADVVRTLANGRESFAERLAIVCHQPADLRASLENFVANRPVASVFVGTAASVAGHPLLADQEATETIAKAWIEGRSITYKTLNPKLPLPTYPFEPTAHWLSVENARTTNAVEPALSQPITAPVVPTDPTDGMLIQLTEYLRNQFADVTGYALDRLTERTTFDEVGLTSMMIVALNERLNTDLGTLPKTLFFECRNLNETVRRILDYQPSQLTAYFGTTDRMLSVKHQPVAEPLASEMFQPVEADAVVIVGLHARMPQADSAEEYWTKLATGTDCITEIPADRWDYQRYYHPDRHHKGTIYSKWGGFIRDADRFDPLFFGISPAEAELLDPQERLFLQGAYAALEDAGYTKEALHRSYGGRVGVYVGVMYSEYQHLGVEQMERGNPVSLGSSPGSIASRVSHWFDLSGPSMAVDTMCSSSLTALDLAVDALNSGKCAMAIVGGVNLSLHPHKYLMHAQMKMVSAEGRCKSFGSQGNGFVAGEGVGVVILTKQSRALQHRDPIYGIIKAVQLNHDGKTNGYTVPNPNAQTALIEEALRKANVHPRTISYIEAHGTGTSLGDPIELTGLTRAFAAQTADKQFCAIGSAKSNIGHLEAASGIAGLIKVCLQLKHQRLAPSIHADELNPNIDFEQTPFVVQRQLSDWKRPVLSNEQGQQIEYPRRAGISSFGAGGVNVHVIIEEYTSTIDLPAVAKPQLFVFSAKNQTTLRQLLLSEQAFLARSGRVAPQESGILTERSAALKALFRDEFTMDVVDTSLSLSDLDFNRGMLLRLADLLSARFAITLSESFFASAPSFDDLLTYINQSNQPSVGLRTNDELSRANPLSASDMAYSLQIGREHHAERVAIVAQTLPEVYDRLRSYLAGVPTDGVFANEGMGAGPAVNREQITEWWQQNDLGALAEIWVGGGTIDWLQLRQTDTCQKVSLPTYPFERQRYWVPEAVETPVLRKITEANLDEPAPVVMAVDPIKQPATAEPSQDLRTWVVSQLIQAASAIVKVPVAAFSATANWGDVGFDSIKLEELARQLQNGLKITLSVNVFYEYLTALALTDYLLREHSETLNTAVDQKRVPQPAEPKVVVKPMSVPTVPIQPGAAMPVAIIGLHAMLPGCEDSDAFWQRLLDGQSVLSDIPAERWDWQAVYGDPLTQPGKTKIKWGGFLADVDQFDPLFFGISPAEAEIMDPQQRLLLECAWKAWEHAGYVPANLPDTHIGVYVGASSGEYEQVLAQSGVPVDAYHALSRSRAMLSNRISHLLNLCGPSLTIDTACSSTLVALHQAVQAIRMGECQLAMIGGVNLLLTPTTIISYDKADMLSSDGIIRTFDESANGYIPSEGVGAFILKPLDQAVRDGDTIHAVVRGTGIAHGGKSLRLTAPHPVGHREAIRSALRSAAIDPATVSYVEAHGVAASVSDAIEVNTFADVYGSPDGPAAYIGSLKPITGHLECASGVAALLKLILAFRHRTLPGNHQLSVLNPKIQLAGSRFRIPEQNQEWSVNDANPIRRAGLHSFGAGGTVAHVILEEPPVRPQPAVDGGDERIVPLSAKNEKTLRQCAASLAAHLEQHPDLSLAELSYTLQTGRVPMPVRVAFVAGSITELQSLLQEWQAAESMIASPKIAAYDPSKERDSLLANDPIVNELLLRSALESRTPTVVATLWARGLAVDWPLYSGAASRRISLPTYPFDKQSYWCVPFGEPANSPVVPDVVKPDTLVLNQSAGAVEEDVLTTLTALLKLPTRSVRLDQPLADYGWDSIRITRFRFALDEQLGVTLRSQDLSACATASELITCVRAAVDEVQASEHLAILPIPIQFIDKPVDTDDWLKSLTGAELNTLFHQLNDHHS